MNDVFKQAFMCRDGSRATATSKMEYFVIIVNDFQPLTIITKCSILDVAVILDPPLHVRIIFQLKGLTKSIRILKSVYIIYNRFLSRKELLRLYENVTARRAYKISLEFPKIVKKPLKILKAILGVFNTVKNNIKSKLKTDGRN